MRLTLPFPPPVNGLYRNTKDRGGRAKTAKYKAWQFDAGASLAIQRRSHVGGRVAGPVHLAFVFGRPDKRKRDLDNLLKAPIDLLVAQGVIDDDRDVHCIVARWSDEIEGVEIVVSTAG